MVNNNQGQNLVLKFWRVNGQENLEKNDLVDFPLIMCHVI
jgi:hypothetical protein